MKRYEDPKESLEPNATESCFPFLRQHQQPLAPPHANDPHNVWFVSVDDAKRWLNQLAQKRLVKFRNDTPHCGVVGQGFDSGEDLSDQLIADHGYALIGIPIAYGFEIRNRGLGEPDGNLGHSVSLGPGAL